MPPTTRGRVPLSFRPRQRAEPRISSFSFTRSNGLARPPLIRTCPVRIPAVPGRSAALRNAGTGTATAFARLPPPSLAMVQAWHSFEKYGLSPCGGGASCPSCRRARSGKDEGGFSCGAQTGNLPPATLLTGGRLGQGIRSARAHDRNRSDARLQTLWRMRASLTRRRPFREKEYSPCSLSCPFPF